MNGLLDTGYSLICALESSFRLVTIVVLWFSSEENHDIPLRLWILGIIYSIIFDVTASYSFF